MSPETRNELKKAEAIIRSVAQDYKDFGESGYLNETADRIGQFVECSSN